MDISPMNHSSSSSYSPFASSYSRHNIDRDALAQSALLGQDAYLSSELESPSPLATPSPMIKQLSPLTVASHLQDNLQLNPFLDEYDTARIEPFKPAPQKHYSVKRDVSQYPRSSLRSTSTMTSSSSGLGLDLRLEDGHHKGHAQPSRQAPSQSVMLESTSAILPTIQETRRPSIPSATRRRTKPAVAMNTYSLPPSNEPQTPVSSPTPTWRRASPFPLGPVPPPLPPRRARYEPQPHIVDVAVERFNINTRTISSPATSTTTATGSSALAQERRRQWQQWEAERVRSLEMTKEAAKNNRVQAPSSSTSSASNRTTSSINPVKPPSIKQKKTKSKWWCFGGGAHESEEEVVDEKRQYGNPKRRSVSSLSAIDVEEAEEDEEEWNEARTASGTGLLSKLSCSKSNNRQRATLKKKTY